MHRLSNNTSLALALTFGRLALVANFGTQIFHLKPKFDMEKNASTNHENGNDADRLLAAVDFNSPENKNRDKSIIGYGPVLKCKCEMPAKIHGKNLCWRCNRPLS